MRVYRFVALGIVALIAAGCSASGGSGGVKCPFMHPNEAKIDAARKVDADFIAAFNKHDADGVAACYADSPDTLLYPPGDIECRGRQQIHDCIAEVFRHSPDGGLEFIDPKYMVSGGDVLVSGQWTITSNGGGRPLRGRFTEVMGQRNGKWAILIDHASVPLDSRGGGGTSRNLTLNVR